MSERPERPHGAVKVAFGTRSTITAVRDPDGNLVELTRLGAAPG